MRKKSRDDRERASILLHSCTELKHSNANVRSSRRHFMQTAFILPAAVAFLPGCHFVNDGDIEQSPASFFTKPERRFIDAATARLIPSDSAGAGAKEAAVGEFINRQLAGPYGRADSWYMQGPWEKGLSGQGYQLKYSPAQLYRIAIRNINDYCKRTYANKDFAGLSSKDQDQVLHGLEKGDIKLADVPAKTFFTMLWKNTQEGFLADPMYGGNRNFAGWKLIGFPGPRYNYVNEITQYGKPYTLPTVGILGRDGTRTLEG
jgi:gluconate 2-dehydrogenase gamma chain